MSVHWKLSFQGTSWKICARFYVAFMFVNDSREEMKCKTILYTSFVILLYSKVRNWL